MRQNQYAKVVVYVPIAYADQMREVLAEFGAGKIGDYEACSFSVRGVGRFRPLKGAEPVVGEVGRLEEVDEERIETICSASEIEALRGLIKEAHPYEEPVVDFYVLS